MILLGGIWGGLIGCSSDSISSLNSTKSPSHILHAGAPNLDSSPTIATVGGVAITQKDLEHHMSQLSTFSRSRYQGAERKQELMDSLIRFELLAQHALTLGYGQDPMVKLTYKQALIKVLVQQEIRGKVKMSDISNEELKKYYQAHQSEYQKPELRRAGIIVLKTQAEADAILKEMQIRLKALPKQERKIFGEFTYQKSIDEPSKLRRGDVGYLAQQKQDSQDKKTPQFDLPQAVRDALFSLQKRHQIYSQSIKTDQGVYLVQLLGRQKAINRTFDDVRAEIHNLLYRQKKSKAMQDYVNTLKSKAKISINQDALNQISLPKQTNKVRPKRPFFPSP